MHSLAVASAALLLLSLPTCALAQAQDRQAECARGPFVRVPIDSKDYSQVFTASVRNFKGCAQTVGYRLSASGDDASAVVEAVMAQCGIEASMATSAERAISPSVPASTEYYREYAYLVVVSARACLARGRGWVSGLDTYP